MITPGPWALRGHQIRGENGLGQHVATYQLTEADGMLIAAAPELLEALKALHATLPAVMAPFGKSYEAKLQAEAAIAKATVKR